MIAVLRSFFSSRPKVQDLRAAAKARYDDAVKRGDKRDQHTAWLQLLAATNQALRSGR